MTAGIAVEVGLAALTCQSLPRPVFSVAEQHGGGGEGEVPSPSRSLLGHVHDPLSTVHLQIRVRILVRARPAHIAAQQSCAECPDRPSGPVAVPAPAEHVLDRVAVCHALDAVRVREQVVWVAAGPPESFLCFCIRRIWVAVFLSMCAPHRLCVLTMHVASPLPLSTAVVVMDVLLATHPLPAAIPDFVEVMYRGLSGSSGKPQRPAAAAEQALPPVPSKGGKAGPGTGRAQATPVPGGGASGQRTPSSLGSSAGPGLASPKYGFFSSSSFLVSS